MRFIGMAICACFMLFSCTTIPDQPVEDTSTPPVIEPILFTPVRNYYMKEKTSDDYPIYFYTFGDQASFDKVLGAARVAQNQITKIDFSKEVAVLMVLPISKTEKKIVVDDVTFRKNNIDVHYHIEERKERAFAAVTTYIFKIKRPETLLDFYFYPENQGPTRVPFGMRVENSPISVADVEARYLGTYKGIVPCASCMGIETELSLKKEGTFILKQTYLGRGTETYKETGQWTLSNDLSSVRLEYQSTHAHYFFIDPHTIEQMDLEGNRIRSDLNYKLTR